MTPSAPFIFVRGPPAQAAATGPDAHCTRAYVAPSLDVVATVVLGGLGVAGVQAPDAPGCPGRECYFNGGAAVRGAGTDAVIRLLLDDQDAHVTSTGSRTPG